MDRKDIPKSSQEGEEKGDVFQQFLRTLPKEKNWEGEGLCLHQGFWFVTTLLQPVISFQQHFQARDTDTILVSFPKCGTTWLKSLSFSIIHRNTFPLKDSPLLTKNPHEVVRFLELDLYLTTQSPNLESIHDPRIFHTHVPYHCLPSSIKVSKCKIVYVCRNPLDYLVSLWNFRSFHELEVGYDDSVLFKEGLEKFCQGISGYGPFWDHVLGYWKESLDKPDNVLFLKYEDIKADTTQNIKKIAKFLEFPFTSEEENEGVIEEIARLCSFDNLRNLEVNKTGKCPHGIQNSAFFRKGEVGDWINYITPSMAERIEKVVEEKLRGSGLTFKRHA